jgi:hypothetical protein
MTRTLLPFAAVGVALAGCGAVAQPSTPLRPPASPAVTARPSATAATLTPTPTAAAAGSPGAPETVAATPGAAPMTSTSRRGGAVPAITRRLNRLSGIAERQYDRETGGAVVRADLRRIAGDPGLRAAARSGSTARLRASVTARFPAWYHRHVSRLQILRGGLTLVDLGVPFVVDGPQTTLPGGDRLRISIQDEIGFVRLVHRHHPVDMVVRGTGRPHVRSSLPSPPAALPAHGAVTLAGRRYAVRSFSRTALGGEPVTVWVLVRG